MKEIKDCTKYLFKYGLRNHKIIHIDELSEKDRGLKCDCICPNCKSKLIARMGQKKQWHFAHLNAECDWKIAYQTILHIMAKEIIEEEKECKFPKVSLTLEDSELYKEYKDIIDYIPNEIYQSIPKEITIKNEMNVTFDEVYLEKRLSSIVPDIIVRTNDRECLIEIAVTHFVDDNKIEKIKELGIPLLEIDLAQYKNEDIDKNYLKNILLNDTECKRWIFNKNIDKADQIYKQKYLDIIKKEAKKQKDREIEYRKFREDEIERRINAYERKKKSQLELQEIFKNTEKYQSIILSLKNKKRAKQIYEKSAMYSKYKKIPFYLNIPIKGEFVFNCDRTIWQTLIFEKFIFSRKKTDSTISIDKIIAYIKNYQTEFNINWQYTYKTNIHGEGILLLNYVLERYLYYLDQLGFISYFFGPFDRCGNVLETNTVMPPDKEYAERLKKVLKRINYLSTNIDIEIDNEFLFL